MIEVLVPVLVVTFMLQAGLDAPDGSYRHVAPSALFRGLVLMLVVGPLLAWGINHALHPPLPIALSLVALSVVGVMPLASRGAGALGGSAQTGVLLTILLGLIVVVTALPSAQLLLEHHGTERMATLPTFLRVVVLQGIPLVLGIGIAHYWPARAAGISKIASIVNKVILLFLGVVVVLPKLGNVTILGWEGFFTTVLFAIVFAAMADLIGGPTVADRRALLVVSSTANVGLALSVLKSSGMVERFGATVMGVFVVRAAVGIVMKMLLARRFAKETREASNPELARLETT